LKKVLLVGFLAGAVAVLAFHQALLHVLHHNWPWFAGLTGLPTGFRPAGSGFSLRPLPPYGVPAVVSAVFWGGLWGVLLAALIRWLRLPDLMMGVVIGIAATFVGFTLVAELRGNAPWGGGDPIVWARALTLNIAFGWGAAFLMRPFGVGGNQR
jgi:xanthine/uracil permease